MKIAFIGGGNMAEAMISAILSKGISQSSMVTVSDVKEERRQYLKQKYGVVVTDSNQQAAGKGNLVVLAIKPQDLAEVMAGLRDKLRKDHLVLSIIAGARIKTLCGGLGHDAVVRAMPNTPAQIGDGMTVWTATPQVNTKQKGLAGFILGAMGKEIYVDNEDFIDKATAVSGSGPAYVFLFAEAMASAAVSIGLPQKMAEELVLQTLAGAAHLLQKSGKSASELSKMVTSPGGTTAEAITEFEKGRLVDLVARAVTAAYEKAKKLGD